jgi:Kef-type K+ transport system membrane component KefB
MISVPPLLHSFSPMRRVAPLAVVQILVGLALGPSGLGRITSLASPELSPLFGGLSTIGVTLFVFSTGMHLDLHAMRRGARGLVAISIGSIAGPLLLGLAAGTLMLRLAPGAAGPNGTNMTFAFAMAVCIAVTALPVLAAILKDLDLISGRLGQTALLIAAINDLALWVLLTMLLVAGSHHQTPVLVVVAATWFIAIAMAAGRVFAHPVLSCPQRTLLAAVSLAIASAGVSEACGTGYLAGAFVAGLVIPRERRALLLATLEGPVAVVLLPFFFVSTGLKVDFQPFSGSFLSVLLLALPAAILGKLAGTCLPARSAGFGWGDSLALGSMLQAKGLMELVVLSMLRNSGLIDGSAFSAMVCMAIICTVATTPAVRLFRNVEPLVPLMVPANAGPS